MLPNSSGLETVVVLVHVGLNDEVQAVFRNAPAGAPAPASCPGGRPGGRSGWLSGRRGGPAGSAEQAQHELRGHAGQDQGGEGDADRRQDRGWARRPASRAAPPLLSVATTAATRSLPGRERRPPPAARREPCRAAPASPQVDRPMRWPRRPRRAPTPPARDHRSQRHHLGDDAEQPPRCRPARDSRARPSPQASATMKELATLTGVCAISVFLSVPKSPTQVYGISPGCGGWGTVFGISPKRMSRTLCLVHLRGLADLRELLTSASQRSPATG